MSDLPQSSEPAATEAQPASAGPPTPTPPPGLPTQPAPPPAEPVSIPPSSPGGGGAGATERPEVAVGAAFAGGLVLAMILKRLAR